MAHWCVQNALFSVTNVIRSIISKANLSTLANSAIVPIVAIVPPLCIVHDVALRVAKTANVKELVVPRATRGLPRRQRRCTKRKC